MTFAPVVTHSETALWETWNSPELGLISFQTLLGSNDDQASGFTAGSAELPVGGWLAPHRHEPSEIYFVTTGKGVLTIDSTPHEVQQGSVIVIPGGSEHSITNTADAPLKFTYVFAVNAFSEVVYQFSSASEHAATRLEEPATV